MPSLQLTRAHRTSAACLAAAVIGAALATPVAAAATTLSNPRVTPASGTTASVFDFRVKVVASNSLTVTAEVSDGTTVQLAVFSGTALNGTYRGSASLPAGTWSVTFVADGPGGGSNDDSIDFPAPITVIQGGTPPPTPSPTPTPTPPPPPTPTVRPTASPTPRPGTPGPTAGPGTPGPTPAPAPGATPQSPDPSASPSGDGTTDPTTTPSGSAFSPAPSATDDDSANPSASIAPSRSEEPGGLGPLPWVVLGATMAGSGAVVLGVQLARRRMRARIG